MAHRDGWRVASYFFGRGCMSTFLVACFFCVFLLHVMSVFTATVFASGILFCISLHHRGEPELHGHQSQGQSGVFQSFGTSAGASELSVFAERSQLFRQWLPVCSDFHLVDFVWHCVSGLAWNVLLLVIPRIDF